MNRKTHAIAYICVGIVAINDAILVAFGVLPYTREGTVVLTFAVAGFCIASGVEKLPECEEHGLQWVRHRDEGLNRCVSCGHRITTSGIVPISSRKLTLKRPWYPVIELRRRRWAKSKGQIHD